MIGLNCVAADNIENADDQEEAVYTCPPSELGEWVVGCLLNLADDASDNGDKPRKLDKPLALTLTISIQRGGEKRGEGLRDGTHKSNRRGGERKRVSQNVARLEASSSVDVGVIHFEY